MNPDLSGQELALSDHILAVLLARSQMNGEYMKSCLNTSEDSEPRKPVCLRVAALEVS